MVTIALSPHKGANELLRYTLAERRHHVQSTFTQMCGLTPLGLLILALVIAIPVAPFDHNTVDRLTRPN